MIVADKIFNEVINSPVRSIFVKVEHYRDSTLINTFTNADAVKSLTVERQGEEGKFFGFSICNRLNLKLIDMEALINIKAKDSFKVYFGVQGSYIKTLPTFYVTETRRDENNNSLSITAYDKLYELSSNLSKELNLVAPYTIRNVAEKVSEFSKLPLVILNVTDTCFDLSYPNGANLEGTENIRYMITAIAEATQTIAYVNYKDELVFKRLDKDGEPILTIDKDKYFTLDSGDNRRINAICSATELGDNVISTLQISGTTQYVRDNPFWELRDDIASIVDNALANVGGLTINQFNCTWRGNFLLEIGDKIALTTKENTLIYSYLLSDTIEYDGSFEETSEWKFENNISESADNPSTLGDALKQTYAKVDKANKQIDLVVGDVKQNSEDIGNIIINTDSISGSVSTLDKKLNDSVNGINDDITILSKRVDSTMTSDQVKLEIKTELDKGVNKVTTETGFTFNQDGLTISKGKTNIATTITENGMSVKKGNDVVLTANADGVDAVNLHASTYLIVGMNSRFENFGDFRTGCFWIGN